MRPAAYHRIQLGLEHDPITFTLAERLGQRLTFRSDLAHLTVLVTFGTAPGRLQVRCVFKHDTQPAYASAEALRCAAIAFDYLGDVATTETGPDATPDLEIDTFQAGIGEVTFTGVDAVIGPCGLLGDAYGEAAPW